MARPAKPFLHQGWWSTEAGGQGLVRLVPEGQSFEDAQIALADHLRRLRNEKTNDFPDFTLKELVNEYLDFIKLNRSAGCYQDHHFSLKGFLKLHARRTARELGFRDAEKYKKVLVDKGRKPATVNHFIVSLNACFNWAVDPGKLIKENPFKKLEKLYAEGRKRTVTPEEFQALLRHCTDALFRQVLLMLRLTGIRPGELRALTWDQVDCDRCRLLISKHKATRTAKIPFVKVVHLPPEIIALLAWRRARYGAKGHVFLNSRGQPWTQDALRQRMDHLREGAGIAPDESGEKLVLYSNRHTFLTEAARGGVTGPQLQSLAGHTTFRMTQKYVHLVEADVSLAGSKAVGALKAQSAQVLAARRHKSG